MIKITKILTKYRFFWGVFSAKSEKAASFNCPLRVCVRVCMCGVVVVV